MDRWIDERKREKKKMFTFQLFSPRHKFSAHAFSLSQKRKKIFSFKNFPQHFTTGRDIKVENFKVDTSFGH